MNKILLISLIVLMGCVQLKSEKILKLDGVKARKYGGAKEVTIESRLELNILQRCENECESDKID